MNVYLYALYRIVNYAIDGVMIFSKVLCTSLQVYE